MDLKENGKYSGTKELAYSIAGCFPPKQRYKIYTQQQEHFKH